MIRRLRYVLLGLAAATIIGCTGDVRYDDLGASIVMNESGNRKTISLRQTILATQLRKEKEYGRFRYTYEPLKIIYTDFQNINGLPRPIPKDLDSKALQMELLEMSYSGQSAGEGGYYQDPEFARPVEKFFIPARIEGKQMLPDGTIEDMIASGQVDLIGTYSLGSLVAIYDTRQSVKVEIEFIERPNDRIGFYDNLGFQLTLPRDGTFGRYEYDSYDKPFIHKGVQRQFDDTQLKNMAVELIWRIAQIEAIESLFEKLRTDGDTYSRVTHFAIKRENDYGLGDTFNADSRARGSLLSSEASSHAETDSRYVITRISASF